MMKNLNKITFRRVGALALALALAWMLVLPAMQAQDEEQAFYTVPARTHHTPYQLTDWYLSIRSQLGRLKKMYTNLEQERPKEAFKKVRDDLEHIYHSIGFNEVLGEGFEIIKRTFDAALEALKPKTE